MHVSYNFLWFFGNVGECDYYSLYVGVVVRWVWLFESRPLCTLWVSWSLSGCWVFWFVEISSEFFSAALVPNYGEMQKENSHAQIGKVCWCIAMRWSMKKRVRWDTSSTFLFLVSPCIAPKPTKQRKEYLQETKYMIWLYHFQGIFQCLSQIGRQHWLVSIER